MKCFETGKDIYLTPQSAHEALGKIEARNARSGRRRAASWHDGKATAYKCSHCNAWHIGHTTPSPYGRIKERARG